VVFCPCGLLSGVGIFGGLLSGGFLSGGLLSGIREITWSTSLVFAIPVRFQNIRYDDVTTFDLLISFGQIHVKGLDVINFGFSKTLYFEVRGRHEA